MRTWHSSINKGEALQNTITQLTMTMFSVSVSVTFFFFLSVSVSFTFFFFLSLSLFHTPPTHYPTHPNPSHTNTRTYTRSSFLSFILRFSNPLPYTHRSSNWHAGTKPRAAASIRGVMPRSFGVLAYAPCRSSTRIASRSPEVG